MNNQSWTKIIWNIQFKSDEDAMKISLFCFIELVMMERERRKHMDWTMLGLIDDLEDFVSYDWGKLIWAKTQGSLKWTLNRKVWAYERVSSINGWVANRASHNTIPCIMARRLSLNNAMVVVKVHRSTDNVFMDVFAPDIDDQYVDIETGTSINEDPIDGIVPINISSGGENVSIPHVQVLLESKEEPIDFDRGIPPYDFFNVVPKEVRDTVKVTESSY
ncbi:Ulp1-like peptidase [Cucumis melo var. makuwa]|uniref:Ulp1-like peptidase n=1 Tax=Cucumis melo var. makuwa TaxID=1194695 RepID=A0A5D3D1I4_CUCMM|nr:Ulp1-like peptidase [Cucumis melo var. makuwa]TYK16546.1 Ulp1-like peptidase [Cucumis melo var. makuwa]